MGLLLLFIWGLLSSIYCGRSFHTTHSSKRAASSYTGSLGPSSRDIWGRVSPLGQPHLCQMSGVWGVAPVASGKGLDREIDQCFWVASIYFWSLLLLYIPLSKSVSTHSLTQKGDWHKRNNRISGLLSIKLFLGVEREEWAINDHCCDDSIFCSHTEMLTLFSSWLRKPLTTTHWSLKQNETQHGYIISISIRNLTFGVRYLRLIVTMTCDWFAVMSRDREGDFGLAEAINANVSCCRGLTSDKVSDSCIAVIAGGIYVTKWI